MMRMKGIHNATSGLVVVPFTPQEEIDADAQEAAYNSMESRRARLKSALADIRYAKETAGRVIGGASIRTDRESQAMVTGAKVFSDMNPTALIDWKDATGWTQIDRATLLVIAQAVGAHVQQCFSRERALSEQIAAATTVAALLALDLNGGWPA